MSRAEELLSCTLTFRDATPRTEELANTFETVGDAVKEWMHVLLHEAHESMKEPLATPPIQPYLHPVDVDTNEPGIVDKRDELHVLRRPPNLPRFVYSARPTRPPPLRTTRVQEHDGTHDPKDAVAAKRIADAALVKELAKAERKAATAERRTEKQRVAKEERKEARERETPEERQTRLEESRRKREERKTAKQQTTDTPPPPRPTTTTAPESEDALLYADTSMTSHLQPLRKRRKGKASFYEHPLPHHRHLQGIEKCAPHPGLCDALLRGEACDELEVVQGPPGTGKTKELVARVARFETRRVLLCAPTNVGAANLYERCVQEGLGDVVSLTLPPERVPLGTTVLSTDPGRRVVCSTISSRSGPILDDQPFECVLVDEAAQCMEAWVWTLLRPEVTHLVLAGDTHQLPSVVSESGGRLKHQRSLMERLAVDLDYANVTTLTVQNRMAPEILRLSNDAFYGGRLVSGPFAPSFGSFEVRIVPEATEERVGTSYVNRNEARVAAEIAKEDVGAVLLTPYVAQCSLLLSYGTQRQVHTVDSMQGREADTVVLSIVRDGTHGVGFWEDERRLNVALTRARRRLVLVCSQPSLWPSTSPLAKVLP